jgi:hypothetical protein
MLANLRYLWLVAGESAVSVMTVAEGSILSPGRGKIFYLLHVVQPVLGPTYLMGTGGSLPGSKAAGAWIWPLASNSRRGQEYLYLYIHSPLCLHGVVLN